MTIRVEPFDAAQTALWNGFVTGAKNGTFLFDRRYMDYHADRFTDASLLFHDEGKLVAVMPASMSGQLVTSHAGLTFGGIVSGAAMSAGGMLEVFDVLLRELRERSVRKLIYKAIPHIYHRIPAEEDLYALFRFGATLVRRDVSTGIRAGAAVRYTERRRRCVSRGRKAALQVERSRDFAAFMAVEEEVLAERHGVRPVHTPEEMELLAGRFPDNIKLYVIREPEGIIAGVIIYESDRVAHVQYIGATERGRELCAQDVLLDHLLRHEFTAKPWFDFGISTEQQGRYLNLGLSENKESWGGRAVVYDHYELDVT
jgi:hypothetical protein